MNIRGTLLAASLLSALALPLVAEAAMQAGSKVKVAFFASGSPGFLDIEGDSNTLTVADDGTKLSFTVPMKSVHTGIDMRDDHMNNEYVDVAHFPNAVLTFAKADVKWPDVGATSKGSVKATFNIHGQDQAVSVDYTIKHAGTTYSVSAKFNYDASAYGIQIPSYMGITVDPKQRAEVNLDLIDG